MKKYIEVLSAPLMTALGGVFLAASLILSLLGTRVWADPAYGTVFISGLPLLYTAIRRIIHNRGISKISSSLLISIAMIAAIAIGDAFAAGEVAFIMAIGELLEDKTTERARRGLKKLIALTPQMGRKIENGTEEMIPAEAISEGDIIRILPGESIPVDGEILSGETSIDQSVITGESLPVDKSTGDAVFCGTVNRFGAIDIRATHVGSDSSLSKLIRMVQEAEDKKAPMQRTADKWASWLVPAAMLIAILAFLFTKDITRAVTVLVVFCPCALVLATPAAIMAAIGQATKHGVIIKSGEALEKMGRVDTIAFDKTGTLTEGRLTVSDIFPLTDQLTESALLAAAAAAERRSEHPLGKAIVSYASEKGLTFPQPETFRMWAGKGVLATVDGAEILCGNEKMLHSEKVSVPDIALSHLSQFSASGKASVLVCVNGQCVGIIALSDILRKESPDVVQKLGKLGTASVLLTGDNRQAAGFFAKKLGISTIFAELLPAEKVDAVTKLQNDGKTVCMVGDGVNDAPALKSADVGVAMGGDGCDIAVEAADIALMRDDVSQIPYLKRLSVATLQTIRLSIFISLFINFVAIFLSLAGVLTPTTGALVHNAGSCLVVLFAARLYDRKFE